MGIKTLEAKINEVEVLAALYFEKTKCWEEKELEEDSPFCHHQKTDQYETKKNQAGTREDQSHGD